MRISDWSSDVCSSDLLVVLLRERAQAVVERARECAPVDALRAVRRAQDVADGAVAVAVGRGLLTATRRRGGARTAHLRPRHALRAGAGRDVNGRANV